MKKTFLKAALLLTLTAITNTSYAQSGQTDRKWAVAETKMNGSKQTVTIPANSMITSIMASVGIKGEVVPRRRYFTINDEVRQIVTAPNEFASYQFSGQMYIDKETIIVGDDEVRLRVTYYKLD